MPGPLLLLEEHVYNEACVLETAVMLSEISIIAGSKEILSVHHFTVLFISPMRYAPTFSGPIQSGEDFNQCDLYGVILFYSSTSFVSLSVMNWC